MTGLPRAVALIAALVLGGGSAVALAAGERPSSAVSRAGEPASHASRTVSRTKPAKCQRVRSARLHRIVCRSARRRPKVGAHALPRPATARPVAPPAKALAPVATAPAQTTSTSPVPTTTTPAPGLPSRVSIDEYEYGIAAGHPVVAAGSVQLNVSDIGQDDHDLVIARNGATVAEIAILHPGAPATTITVDLAPGTYTLYCSLYDHAQMGMTTTLVAR